MRALILLVLGLAVGAIGASSMLNALNRREAFPRGLMNVMQHHVAALRQGVRAGRCDDAPRHVAALQSLAADIDAAISPDASPESAFLEYERRLTEALAPAATVSGCGALAPMVDKIGAACDACHQQYR